MTFRKQFFLSLFLLPLFAHAQVANEVPYKIYSVERKAEISLDRLVKDLKKADVVFFGEEHDDSVAHVLERLLLEGLHGQHRKDMTLSMEMFQSDAQLVLDEYTNGLITEKNLESDGRLWKNYADYRPMVEYAREQGLQVLAANAPSRYTNRVTRSGLESLGVLSEEAKALLAPLPIDTLTGPYYEEFTEMMGGHEGMGGMKVYQSQNLWDATMAWRISQWAASHPQGRILHLNGRFHSDHKLGAYAQLMHYAPELRCRNISSFRTADFENPKWKEWSALADFIVITKPVKP